MQGALRLLLCTPASVPLQAGVGARHVQRSVQWRQTGGWVPEVHQLGVGVQHLPGSRLVPCFKALRQQGCLLPAHAQQLAQPACPALNCWQSTTPC